MIEVRVTQKDGSLDVECGFNGSGRDLVTETAAAVLTIAARAESLIPGGSAAFRALLMAALTNDEVWDRSYIVTPEDRGAMQS